MNVPYLTRCWIPLEVVYSTVLFASAFSKKQIFAYFHVCAQIPVNAPLGCISVSARYRPT